MLNIFVQDDPDPGGDGPQQTQFEPVGDGGQGQGSYVFILLLYQ